VTTILISVENWKMCSRTHASMHACILTLVVYKYNRMTCSVCLKYTELSLVERSLCFVVSN